MLFSLILLSSLSSAKADTPSSSNVSTITSNTIQNTFPIRNLPPTKLNPNPNGNRTKAKITIPKYKNNPSGHCLDEILCEDNQGKMYHPQHNPTKKDIKQPKVKWKNQIFRIYLLNVNGISLGNDAADLTDVFLQMENIRADAICLTETKLAADQPYVKSYSIQRRTKCGITQKLWPVTANSMCQNPTIPKRGEKNSVRKYATRTNKKSLGSAIPASTGPTVDLYAAAADRFFASIDNETNNFKRLQQR